MSSQAPFRCGHVAIVGRPNTGKSTLLNRLVGQTVSITADRAQTTRHRVLAVLTRPDAQLVLIDSPGYQTRQLNPLNQLLNRTAQSTSLMAWNRNDDVVPLRLQRIVKRLHIGREAIIVADHDVAGKSGMYGREQRERR